MKVSEIIKQIEDPKIIFIIIKYIVPVLLIFLGIYFWLASLSQEVNMFLFKLDPAKNDVALSIRVISFFIIISGILVFIFAGLGRKKDDINASENSSQERFFNQINLDEIDEIQIIAHTGNRTLSKLKTKLENNKNTIQIKVLLKYPKMENSSRQECTNAMEKALKNDKERSQVTIDFRYYNGLPSFNAIMCFKRNKLITSYISYYSWNLENRKTSISDNWHYVVTNNSSLLEKNLYSIVKSHFDYLYGKKFLHTIIFDLDDTLIDSLNLQKQAWLFLFEKIFTDQSLEHYRDKVKQPITKDNYKSELDKKFHSSFLNSIHTKNKWEELFNHLSDKEIIKLNTIRKAEREKLTTEKASLFPGCKEFLEVLSQDYNLVVLSATSENIIKKILEDQGIASYFSFYLGEDNAIDQWEMENKTPFLIKISNLTGIPLSRMMFIGDSQIDYKAAKQLNMSFLAANMVAIHNKIEQKSFVPEALGFSSYVNKKNDETCAWNAIKSATSQ